MAQPENTLAINVPPYVFTSCLAGLWLNGNRNIHGTPWQGWLNILLASFAWFSGCVFSLGFFYYTVIDGLIFRISRFFSLVKREIVARMIHEKGIQEEPLMLCAKFVLQVVYWIPISGESSWSNWFRVSNNDYYYLENGLVWILREKNIF